MSDGKETNKEKEVGLYHILVLRTQITTQANYEMRLAQNTETNNQALTVVDLGGALEGGRDVVAGGGPLPVQVRPRRVRAQVPAERAICRQ